MTAKRRLHRGWCPACKALWTSDVNRCPGCVYKQDRKLARLIEKVRKMPPMTELERREQAASFAYGQLALTKRFDGASPTKLAELRELCRRMAGCEPKEVA